MISSEVIKFARRVLGSVRTIQFDELAAIDVMDRLGLLTVVSGLRDVAAFGFSERNNGGRMETLKGILTAQGLCCLVTEQIRPQSNEPLSAAIGSLFNIFDRLDVESYSRETAKLLWVFRDLKQEEQIKKAVERQLAVGSLLGYPACCVAQHELVQNNLHRAFAIAIVETVGKDAGAVERALRDDLQVDVKGEDPYDQKRMARTDELFPFVFHAACDACLSTDQSPTKELNRNHENLAQQYDRAFHHWYREVRKIQVKIEKLVFEAESQGRGPDDLEEPLKSQYQTLCEERDSIYSRLF